MLKKNQIKNFFFDFSKFLVLKKNFFLIRKKFSLNNLLKKFYLNKFLIKNKNFNSNNFNFFFLNTLNLKIIVDFDFDFDFPFQILQKKKLSKQKNFPFFLKKIDFSFNNPILNKFVINNLENEFLDFNYFYNNSFLQKEEVLFFIPDQFELEEHLLTESFLQTKFDYFYLNLDNSFTATPFPFIKTKTFLFFKNNFNFFKFLNLFFLFFNFLFQLFQKIFFLFLLK